MDFRLPEEARSLQNVIKDFCKREIDWKLMDELDKKEDPRERIPWHLMEKLHDMGIRTITVPEKYGGGGANWLTTGVVVETLAQYGHPLTFTVSMTLKYCLDFADFFNEEQQDEFFPKFIKDYRYCAATSVGEPDSQGDIILPYDEPGAAMKVFAYRDGDEYVINGDKYHCTGGGIATVYLAYARTDKKAPLSEGASAFIVPADTPGLSIARFNHPLGWRSVPDVALYFDNCRIPARYLVGEENKGLSYQHGRMSGNIVHWGAMVGAAQRIYELCLERAKTRIGGGKPLFEHTHVGQRVADMLMCTEAMRTFLYKHLWEYDQWREGLDASVRMKIPTPLGWHMVNIFLKEMSLRVLSSACEVFGGDAVMVEFPIAEYIRDTYTWQHLGGTPPTNYIKAMQYL